MSMRKTSFGIWLAHFILDNNTTMAEVAKRLKMSPSLLSHISTGRRSIPRNLHYAFITEYKLDENAVKKLEEAIDRTEGEGILLTKPKIPCVVSRVEIKQPWTKDMMKLFAMCVNELTEKEATQYIKQFREISERPYKD